MEEENGEAEGGKGHREGGKPWRKKRGWQRGN